MIRRFAFLAATIALLLGAFGVSDLWAADPVWDFDHRGEVTAGYRFADVKGAQGKFEELFNVQKGFRLFDFTLNGDARERKQSITDGYALTATGLGGDPFQTVQLTTGKAGRFDLRSTWRQSYYYWNRNDNVVLPITSATTGLSTGLTANHDWSTVRRMGSFDLTVHATNNLRFTVDVFRSSVDGMTRTTRSLDYFGSPSYWQSFARANPYPFDAPLEDRTWRLAGGVDYTWRAWNFHYVTGYQTFSEDVSLGLLIPGERSVNPATLSQSEPLNSATWSQTRKLITPVSEFSFLGAPRHDVEWRGSYIYSHNRGPAAFDAAFSGIAPSNSANVLAPYTLSETVGANVRESAHVVSQGFTWRLKPWWALDLDYRYSRFATDSINDLESVFNGAASVGSDEINWRNGVSELTFTATLTPVPKLVLRPGVRLAKTDIEAMDDGVIDVPRTQRIKRAQPEFRFGYTPSSMINVRGSITNSVSNVSYTPITPHTRTAGNVIVRFRPIPNLSIENTFNASTATLLDSSYRSSIRADSIALSYVWNDRLSLFGGLSYDSFYAQGDIEYARGTPPTSFLRDQEIHRVWQAGVDMKPVHSVGIRASANYDRLTGRGIIDGEPPAYGPVRWPLASATVYYDCATVGRLSVDLARSYYIEELVTADNFSANLLTIRFTRKF